MAKAQPIAEEDIGKFRQLRLPLLTVEMNGRYGEWDVVCYAGAGSKGAKWLCRCATCDSLRIVSGRDLRTGHSKRCVHCSAKRARAAQLDSCETRGVSHLPEYTIWIGMKVRCLNEKDPNYCYYGGRGVKIHDEWLRDFAAFYQYIGPRPSPAHSIDRIDPDGNYEPGNVRWVTSDVQQMNKRNVHKVEIDGRVLSVNRAAKEAGLHPFTVRRRLRRGVPLEEALKSCARTRS